MSPNPVAAEPPIVHRLRALGYDPIPLTWREGTWISRCPGCGARYLGRHLRVERGTLRCANGCARSVVMNAIDGAR